MPVEPLVDRVHRLLDVFIARRGFKVSTFGDQSSDFGAAVRLESKEFFVELGRDRGQDFISIGTYVRRKPRAHLSSWPLGHILAFLDGKPDPYGRRDLETSARQLCEREEQILDSILINSKELNRWAVRASRRMFGQRKR